MISQETQYLQVLRDLLNKGKKVRNRTGVPTLRLLDEVLLKFDMSTGEFPLLTTKRVWFKGIAHELLWFLKGDSNIKYLVDNGVNIWNDDSFNFYLKNYKEVNQVILSKENWLTEIKNGNTNLGTLGNVYGKQWTDWESSREIIRLVPRIKENIKSDSKNQLLFKLETCTQSDNDDLIGTIRNSINYGEFIVLAITGKDEYSRKLYRIQFTNTGFIINQVRRDVVLQGNIKDKYLKLDGIRCIGNISPSNDLEVSLYNTWAHMLDRCYTKTCKEYPYYGEKGIFVDERWHTFEYFLEDCKTLPQWLRKKRNPEQFQLDKDYFGSNCYSKETCVWLSKNNNMLYRDARPFEYKIPGELEWQLAISKTDVAEKLGLNTSKICAVLNNTRKHHKGYIFRYIDDKNHIYRYILSVNQIANLVHDIKNSPDSRRLILTAWNPADVPLVALPSCHVLSKYTVDDGYLHCFFFMRSWDFLLGGPYNIASYALLTSMLAHVTGLKPGRVTAFASDCHLYTNHLAQAEEQSKREPYPFPKLWLNPEVKNIDDFTYEDIKIEGYQSHEAIKAELVTGALSPERT